MAEVIEHPAKCSTQSETPESKKDDLQQTTVDAIEQADADSGEAARKQHGAGRPGPCNIVFTNPAKQWADDTEGSDPGNKSKPGIQRTLPQTLLQIERQNKQDRSIGTPG